MRGLLLAAALTGLLLSCSEPKEDKAGFGVITFELDDSTQVVLETGTLEFEKPIIIKNSTENIVLRPMSENVFSVPVFGGSISGRWNSSKTAFSGVWTDSLRPGNYTVPVKILSLNEPPKKPCGESPVAMEWSTTKGRLVASVSCGVADATFLTPIGDYRFLSGFINDRRLKLVTFDGAHLFHITANVKGDSLVNGIFKSGTHYSGSLKGVRDYGENLTPMLEQEADITQEFSFSGINASGDTVMWSHERLEKEGKRGLVVDVLGTWCPNCYDEISLLKDLQKSYPDVVFVSMAFERKDLDHSLKRIASFKSELGIDWEVLYGGVANKKTAEEKLPFLGGVKSFPTTAFISANGNIKVHTGFNGPATGPLYEEEKRFFEEALRSL